MNTHNWIQIAAAIGTVVSIPMLYHGLTADLSALAVAGFALFAVSMVATPIHELKRRFGATE